MTEVTIKTFQGRFFFFPSKRLNELLVGVLARGQQMTDMTICAVVVMTNHIHLLLVPDSAEQMRDFFQFVNSNIATEMRRRTGWVGGIFRKPYSHVTVSHEPVAQVSRLRYLLAHGVKEGLVRHPRQWPGVNCVKALLSGRSRLRGVWVDRSAFWEALRSYRRGRAAKNPRPRRRPREKDFTTVLELKLDPLPCWQSLSPSDRQIATAEQVELILEEHARLRAGVPSDWKRRLRQRNVGYRPEQTKQTPRPLVHAATARERRRLVRAIRRWIDCYRLASSHLRQGRLDALDLFPAGAFVPVSLVPRQEWGIPPPRTGAGALGR